MKNKINVPATIVLISLNNMYTIFPVALVNSFKLAFYRLYESLWQDIIALFLYCINRPQKLILQRIYKPLNRIEPMGENQNLTYEELAAELSLLKRENSFLKDRLAATQCHFNERKKELFCHEQAVKLIGRLDLSHDELMNRLVRLLPHGFSQPPQTSAQIELDGNTYQSENCGVSQHFLHSEIVVNGKIEGSVSVWYNGETGIFTGSPFLEEEKMLLNSLAELIGVYLLQHRKRNAREAIENVQFDVLSNIEEVIFRLSPRGKIVVVNSPVTRVLGYSPEELIGRSIADIVYSADLPVILAMLKDKRKKARKFECRVRCKDGRVRWMQSSNMVIRERGEIIGRIGVLFDIHEEKQAQQKLKATELKFRELVEQLNDVVYSINVEGTFRYVSSGVQRITGTSAEELIGKNIYDYIHAEDRTIIAARFSELKNGEDCWLECRFVSAKGFVSWIRLSAKKLKSNEKVVILAGVLVDITELKEAGYKLEKLNAVLEELVEQRTRELESANRNLSREVDIRTQAEKKLIHQNRRLEYVMEGAELGAWQWNVQTGKLIVNRRWIEMRGLDWDEFSANASEEWVGLQGFQKHKPSVEHTLETLSKSIHDDEKQVSVDAMQDHLDGKSDHFKKEYRIQHNNGNWIWLYTSGKIISKNEKGEPQTIFGVTMDITEKKKRELDLQFNKEILQIISNSAPSGILLVDGRSDEILHYTKRFCKIWKIEHLEGKLRRRELKASELAAVINSRISDNENNRGAMVPFCDTVSKKAGEAEVSLWGNRTIRCFSNLVLDAKGEYNGRLYLCEDITKRKAAELFEAHLLGLSSEMIRLAHSNIREAISTALEQIGLYLDVDNAYIFRLDKKQETFSSTHQWNCGITERRIDLNRMPLSTLPNVMAELQKHKPVHLASIHQLPDSWKAERDLFSSLKIKSVIILPLIIEGDLVGFSGLDYVRFERRFSNVKIGLLNMWSVLLANLIYVEKTDGLLAQTRSNYENFFNSINDFLFVINEKGRIVHANRVAISRLGYCEEELMDGLFSDIHQSIDPEEDILYGLDPEKQSSVYLRTLMFCKDGRHIPGESSVVKGMWNGQEVFLCITQDITEKLKAEDDLKKSEERWQFALESAGDGIWDYDLANNEFFFSSAFLETMGYQDVTNVGKITFIKKTVHPDDLGVVIRFALHIRHNKGVFEDEFRILDIFGRYRWILVRGKINRFDEKGRPLRMLGTITDISARKGYEISLAESLNKEKELSEMKSRFVSITSHEFRTPLATILIAADTLETYRNRMSDSAIEEKVTRIKENVKFLREVMEKVLNLSRIDSGKITFDPKPANLSLILQELVFRLKEGGTRNRQIVYDLVPLENGVFVDEQMVRQMVSNLLSNSIKYSPESSIIFVRLKEEKDKVLIEIEDHGIGIKPEDENRIFQPFIRGQNVGNIHGTGLGLSLSQSFARYHGGEISFVSEPNVKTVFTVSLPKQCENEGAEKSERHLILH